MLLQHPKRNFVLFISFAILLEPFIGVLEFVEAKRGSAGGSGRGWGSGGRARGGGSSFGGGSRRGYSAPTASRGRSGGGFFGGRSNANQNNNNFNKGGSGGSGGWFGGRNRNRNAGALAGGAGVGAVAGAAGGGRRRGGGMFGGGGGRGRYGGGGYGNNGFSKPRSSGIGSALRSNTFKNMVVGAAAGYLTYKAGKAIIRNIAAPMMWNNRRYYWGSQYYPQSPGQTMCRMPIQPNDPQFGNVYSPDQFSRPKEIVWSCSYNEDCCGHECCPRGMGMMGGGGGYGGQSQIYTGGAPAAGAYGGNDGYYNENDQHQSSADIDSESDGYDHSGNSLPQTNNYDGGATPGMRTGAEGGVRSEGNDAVSEYLSNNPTR